MRSRHTRVIPRGLVVLGFGGHSRSVADVALDLGIAELVFVEADAQPGEAFAGFPVHGAMPDTIPDGWQVFPAAGDNTARQAQVAAIESRGWPVATLISRCAYVGYDARIAAGSFVAHHAHVGPLVQIGAGALINTAAVVDHECRIGNFTHVSVNATVAGRTRIGNLVFVGAGATVIDRLRITDKVTIGAGAAVVADITEPGIYVGQPARRVRNPSP
jgi:sugar O-acyltransferase (sialic acid O-acetyltransferase NeuD family)